MGAAAHFFCFMLKFECHLGETYYSGMIVIRLIETVHCSEKFVSKVIILVF